MKKFVSLVLTTILLCTTLGSTLSSAEGVEQKNIRATVKPIIEVDGLQFKDLNANGQLDAYEDWRLSTDLRVDNLLSLMTVAEKTSLLFVANISGRANDMDPDTFVLSEDNQDRIYMDEFGIRSFLDNSNGTPAQQAAHHNAMQTFAEGSRLGIPVTFASDRAYNTWGGMVDATHAAFGSANDAELVAEIVAMQVQEMDALGYQVIFHPSAVELGESYGEDPDYVAELISKQITAITENGVQACSKHFIAKSFTSSASPAQSLENWIKPWKAAIDAGTGWIMTNNQGLGLSGRVLTDFDSVTINYLRNDLGYDGIIVTDWGSFGSHSTAGHASGTTVEGLNLDEHYLDAEVLYTAMLTAGVDMFGSGTVLHGTTMESAGSPNLPEALTSAVEKGICDITLVNRAAARVLTAKFDTGMFEDPYADLDKALSLAASAEYLAEPWDITDNKTLTAARNPELVAKEESLQAKATTLIKNDNELLPLKAGTKVYVTGTTEDAVGMYKEYLSADLTIVETMQEADVVIVDVTALNDAAELYVDDAKEAGKPLVITMNSVKPDTWSIENADAMLYINVKRTPDHGSAMTGDFSYYIDPWIYADMITGKRNPEGIIVEEIARSTDQESAEWGDVANDTGANEYVRLILSAIQLSDPDAKVPVNYGDPLLCYEYGMRYGETADFEFGALTLPVQYERTEELLTFGTFTFTNVIVTESHNAKIGEPFTVYALVFNNGADGIMTVDIKDGETVLASKVMAVNNNSWRIVTFDVTLDTLGEHTISIGDQSGVVTVIE